MTSWHPNAHRVPYPDAGSFVNAGHKLVWHTTEGTSLPRYSGDAPHFTFDPRTNELWQHIGIDRAAAALMHPQGTVETNHAHAIQVELIGFAKDTATWPDSYYRNIAALARWIEKNAGVPRRAGVHFTAGGGRQAARLSPAGWLAYAGHCGHEHVPSNFHWDPGQFRIGKVLDLEASKVDFTDNERRTLYLLMEVRSRKRTPVRVAAIARYKAAILVYRAKLRLAARRSGRHGWDIHDRRRRYNGLLTVYKGGHVTL